MAKYAEVREKQRHVDGVAERALDAKLARGVWVGFTFRAKKDAERALRDKEDKERRRAGDDEGEEGDEALYTLF